MGPISPMILSLRGNEWRTRKHAKPLIRSLVTIFSMPFVRPANPKDLPALLAFDQMQEISAQVIESGNCIVAGFDDAVFAYAILSRNFYNRRFLEIIFVH